MENDKYKRVVKLEIGPEELVWVNAFVDQVSMNVNNDMV
jgi:hypothetical protein